MSGQPHYAEALRWIYKNGFRHSSECPDSVNEAFNLAFAEERAARERIAADVVGNSDMFRDPICTDCGARYGAFHGVDCKHPGTWRESRAAKADRARALSQASGEAA